MKGWGLGPQRGVGGEVNRFTAAWRKLRSIKGEADEATPEVCLESDRPEYGFVKGEVLGYGGGTVAPLAANNGFVMLANPAGSNTLIVVTDVWAAAPLASSINLSLNDLIAPLVTNNRQGSRDTRIHPQTGFNLGTTGVIFTGTNVGAFGNTNLIGQWYPQIARTNVEQYISNLNVVLAPGHNLVAWNNVVNQGFDATFLWYERAIESGELLRA